MNHMIWIGFIFFGLVLTGCDSTQDVIPSDTGTSVSAPESSSTPAETISPESTSEPEVSASTENAPLPEEPSSSEITDSTAAGQPQQTTVAGLFESSDLVVTATFAGMGEIVGQGNGVIDLGDGMVIDDTSYYAEYKYQIDEVLQGDAALAGTEIAVLEYLGMGEQTAEMPVPQPEYSEGAQQLLFIAADDEGCYYFVNADTVRVALSEDGTPNFPDTLTDADSFPNLDALRAFAQ